MLAPLSCREVLAPLSCREVGLVGLEVLAALELLVELVVFL